MSEAFEITPETLRSAIRQRISDGVSRRAITLLINATAPLAAGGRDDGTGVRRLPVEAIAPEQRAAFLIALSQLKNETIAA